MFKVLLLRILPLEMNIPVSAQINCRSAEKKDLSPNPMLTAARAFTLLELLGVIAIIGILMVMMIPVLDSTRDSARLSACRSNLRQLGTGVYLYALDHEDHTPPNINPKLDPPRRDDLQGTFVGGTTGDIRTLGWLVPAEMGGPPKALNQYIDNVSVLFCPSLSDKVYEMDDEYKRPEKITRDNPLVRTGYVWVYRIPRAPDDSNYEDGYFADNANHKVTNTNSNVPYAFDFGWTKGGGHEAPAISIPSHQTSMNILHLGGHITTISQAVAEQYEGYDAFYRYLAGNGKEE